MRLNRGDTLKFLGAGAGISAAGSSLPVKADASAVEFHHGVAAVRLCDQHGEPFQAAEGSA